MSLRHTSELLAGQLARDRERSGALLDWDGETAIDPPPPARGSRLRLDDNWSAEGLRAPRPRTVVPDAVLEIARADRDASRVLLVEYDRTTRVDKNYENFRRNDAFLTWWWRQTPLLDRREPPRVVFVCQDQPHRDKFLAAADSDLTGQLWHPSARPSEKQYPGRRCILFTCEADVHAGILQERRVAGYPSGHPARRGALAESRGVRLPGPTPVEQSVRDAEPAATSTTRPRLAPSRVSKPREQEIA